MTCNIVLRIRKSVSHNEKSKAGKAQNCMATNWVIYDILQMAAICCCYIIVQLS